MCGLCFVGHPQENKWTELKKKNQMVSPCLTPTTIKNKQQTKKPKIKLNNK